MFKETASFIRSGFSPAMALLLSLPPNNLGATISHHLLDAAGHLKKDALTWLPPSTINDKIPCCPSQTNTSSISTRSSLWVTITLTPFSINRSTLLPVTAGRCKNPGRSSLSVHDLRIQRGAKPAVQNDPAPVAGPALRRSVRSIAGRLPKPSPRPQESHHFFCGFDAHVPATGSPPTHRLSPLYAAIFPSRVVAILSVTNGVLVFRW